MLTDPANPRAHEYDVTVYQMGWRLGGKGASGRNADSRQRIEEHGLHIWFGSYDNAFRMIRGIYRELGRAPDAPLANWREAFKPHSFIVLKEHVGDEWLDWGGDLPTNDMLPGDGEKLLLPLSQYVLMAIELLLRRTHDSHAVQSPTGRVWVRTNNRIVRTVNNAMSNVFTVMVRGVVFVLERLHWLARWLGRGVGVLVWLLGFFVGWLWRRVRKRIDTDTHLRREWILFNFFYANARGCTKVGLRRGLDALNDYDYREFLAKYGYDDGGVMANSSWVLGIYDGVFAFRHGDNTIPEGEAFPPHAKVEAGNVIKAGIRQFFAYKGASIWKMQAGMGDTIFGPIYEVLRRRGVKFEFFHHVRDVRASEDAATVDTIEVVRQVPLAGESYDPLVMVKGLPCWPSQPLWDQLEDGVAQKAAGVDFESYAHDWPKAETRTLRRGEDFDEVVFGISVGAIPYVAPDLVGKSEKWRTMIEKMETVRTQAFQLWLHPTAHQLGWTAMGRPITTCYEISPFDTWGDMTHLIEREDWSDPHYPLNLAYFCGVMKDETIAMSPSGPREDREKLDQRSANAKVHDNALRFLGGERGGLKGLFPKAIDPTDSLRWSLLVDPSTPPGHDAARFDSQFWKGNVQPSERYVLSVPGSSKVRLNARDPEQFTNMVVAGDWTNNGFNLGCVEAAAMSGMLASNALSGFPRRKEIVGLWL